MLIFYRISGLLLLFGSGCSAVSLIARIPNLRIPVLIIALILSASLGGYGVFVYCSRNPENQEWLINLGLLIAISVTCVIGGIIQWV